MQLLSSFTLHLFGFPKVRTPALRTSRRKRPIYLQQFITRHELDPKLVTAMECMLFYINSIPWIKYYCKEKMYKSNCES